MQVQGGPRTELQASNCANQDGPGPKVPGNKQPDPHLSCSSPPAGDANSRAGRAWDPGADVRPEIGGLGLKGDSSYSTHSPKIPSHKAMSLHMRLQDTH